MFEDLTNQLNELLKNYQYTDTHFTSVIISDRITTEVLDELPRDYMVICDDNLKGLALSIFPGERIVSLGNNLIADVVHVEQLVKNNSSNTLVAFGSGTINDICKYASFKMGRNYYLFPTAASMNGYLSCFASLKLGGHSQSFRAQLPKTVYVALDVIEDAPKRLYYSGIGDLLCSVNTHLEWWLASLYSNNGYSAELASLLEGLENDFLEGLVLEEMSRVKFLQLMKLIFYSGLVMTITGSSSSASQSEHGFVHAFDLLYPKVASELLHGEKVAYFTQYSLKMWQKLIKVDDLYSCLDSNKYFMYLQKLNVGLRGVIAPESLQKTIDNKIAVVAAIKKFAGNEKKSWHKVISNVISALGNSRYYSRVKILSIVAARLEQRLLSNLRVENAIKLSPFIRDRFTIADLCMLTFTKN